MIAAHVWELSTGLSAVDELADLMAEPPPGGHDHGRRKTLFGSRASVDPFSAVLQRCGNLDRALLGGSGRAPLSEATGNGLRDRDRIEVTAHAADRLS